MLRTRVPLGDLMVEVEESDLRGLLREASRIREMHEAGEGHTCVAFHRHAGGYDFYGLRRTSDGYEVQFGQHKAGPGVEAGELFCRRRTSPSYVGFEPPRVGSAPEDRDGEPVGPEPERRGPDDEHAAMIYYVRGRMQKIRRLGMQMSVEGRQVALAGHLGTEAGWAQLVDDKSFAAVVVRRIESYTPDDRLDVETELRENGRRVQGAPGRSHAREQSRNRKAGTGRQSNGHR